MYITRNVCYSLSPGLLNGRSARNALGILAALTTGGSASSGMSGGKAGGSGGPPCASFPSGEPFCIRAGVGGTYGGSRGVGSFTGIGVGGSPDLLLAGGSAGGAGGLF